MKMNPQKVFILFSISLWLVFSCKDVDKIIPCVEKKSCTLKQINQCYPGYYEPIPCPGDPFRTCGSKYIEGHCELQTHALCEDDNTTQNGCRSAGNGEISGGLDDSLGPVLSGASTSCGNCKP